MQTHRIKGGGGVDLAVTDQGRKDAHPIVLIHGWAQDATCWRAQLPLADEFRVIALDLRGHGNSGAPQDAAAYTDSAMWATDIDTVIQTLGLDRPVLVGWSYGSRVIAAYLDGFGDDAISGVVLVGGILAIGQAREDWMVGPSSPALIRDLYTDDDTRRRVATDNFVRACTYDPLGETQTLDIIERNMTVTALVRRAMFATDLDFRPTYANLNKPMLVIHGVEDAVVAPLTGITASELVPDGDLILYEDTGHAPFLEMPDRFNADLSLFTQTAIGVAA